MMLIYVNGEKVDVFLSVPLCPLCSSWLKIKELTTKGTKNTKIHKKQNRPFVPVYDIVSRNLTIAARLPEYRLNGLIIRKRYKSFRCNDFLPFFGEEEVAEIEQRRTECRITVCKYKQRT